jgi:hypothetical protein
MINGFNQARWTQWFLDYLFCEKKQENLPQEQCAADREETNLFVDWLVNSHKLCPRKFA